MDSKQKRVWKTAFDPNLITVIHQTYCRRPSQVANVSDGFDWFKYLNMTFKQIFNINIGNETETTEWHLNIKSQELRVLLLSKP